MADLAANMRGPWVVAVRYTPELKQDWSCQHWFQVLDHLEQALRRGATEVRIRPVKP